MPMHRKNTARGPKRVKNLAHGEEPWFRPNVIRQRKRNKMAAKSRRRNRQ